MLSLAFAGPVPTETGKIALSFTHAIHVVSSWGVLFYSCGPCRLVMGRFKFVMGRFAAAHGAQTSARWRSGERQAGEWQHVEAILCDRHATVILNGVKIIDNAPLCGVTSGAITLDKSISGPIVIQGSHNGGAYRNMVLTPILKR